MILSDDSDSSDYHVEDFIVPETIRRTYNRNDDDLLSGSGDDFESDEEGNMVNCTNNEAEKTEETAPIVNEPESEDEEEVARTNNRFILHISNINFGKSQYSKKI